MSAQSSLRFPGDGNAEPSFKGSLGWRDEDDLGGELEVSKGVPPHDFFMLQRPSTSSVAANASRSGTGGLSGHLAISSTILMHGAGAPPTLAAALSSNAIFTYDLETRRVKQTLLGHAYGVEGMAAAPTAWQQPHTLASCSRSGDVKLWDLRSRSGAAAITLTNGSTEVLNALVLASSSGAGSGGGGGATALGAGMLCFAGGQGEAVWAWDLRGGQARPLYELSTGNMTVQSLVWHQGSNSLIAACESPCEHRHGGCDQDNFRVLEGRGGSSGSGEDGGSDYGGDERWWPKRARHQPGDFGRFLSVVQSCVLKYKFSTNANQIVPFSEPPSFDGYY